MERAAKATEEMERRWAEFLKTMRFRALPGNLGMLHALRPLAWRGDTVTLGTPYAGDAEVIEEDLLPRLRRHLDEFFPGTTWRVRPLNGEGDGSRTGAKAQEEGETRGSLRPGEGETEEDQVEDAVEVEAVTDPALARFDVSLAGWSKLANYAFDFWAEMLGPAAFLTWMAIRREDIRRNKSAWTPMMSFSASRLARQAADGNRQAITGVWRTCRAASILRRGEPCPHCGDRGGQVEGHTCRFWKPGALDRLQAEGVALVERRGEGLHLTYRLRVFTLLPLLTPAQVAGLHPSSQEQHGRWLLRQGLDPAGWERLTVRHLALPPL